MGPALQGVSSRLNFTYLFPGPPKCMEVCNELKMFIIRPEVRLAALLVLQHQHVNAFLHWRWRVWHCLLAFKVFWEHLAVLRFNQLCLFGQINSELQNQLFSLRLAWNDLLQVCARLFLVEQRCDYHSLQLRVICYCLLKLIASIEHSVCIICQITLRKFFNSCFLYWLWPHELKSNIKWFCFILTGMRLH